MRFLLPVVVAIQCLLWASANAQGWTGDRVFLDVSIQFIDARDRSAVRDADVFIIETMNRRPAFSQKLRTDERGVIRLRGHYCLPMSVGVAGGYVAIGSEGVRDAYVVTVTKPAAAEDFGLPELEGARKLENSRATCSF